VRFVATELGRQILFHLGFQHPPEAELIAQLTGSSLLFIRPFGRHGRSGNCPMSQHLPDCRL
jgi:hypothetical protein